MNPTFIAIPTELKIIVDEARHTKRVYDKLLNHTVNLGNSIGFVGSTEEEVTSKVTERVRSIAKIIICNNGGGLEIKDFIANAWVQKIDSDGSFVLRPSGGQFLKL